MEERQDLFTSANLADPSLNKSAQTKELHETPELKEAEPEVAANQLVPVEKERTKAEETGKTGKTGNISDLTSAMPSARSKAEVDGSSEPLMHLPRIFVGLVYVLLATLVLTMLAQFAAGGLPRMLWAGLPMQIYFTYCILRLSDVLALKRGGAPPLSHLAVAIISLISFTCMPLFGDTMLFRDYHFPNRLLDPFWILWALSQSIWPFILSQALEKGTRMRTVLVTLASAIPFMAMAAFPIMFSFSFFFVPLSVITQVALFIYFSYRLRQVFCEDLNVMSAKIAAVKDQVSGVKKDDIVIRYRPYGGIERWLRDRFTGGDLLKGTQLMLLWVSVPVIAVLLYCGMAALDFTINASAIGTQSHLGRAAAQAAANDTWNFLRTFLLFVAALVGVPLGIYLRAPTHVLFNRRGQRFLRRHAHYASDGKEIDWESLVAIDLERPAGSTQALDQYLCFRAGTGKVTRLKLSAIESMKDREKLLAIIRNWAPNVTRSPEVDQCLEPPANHSYTEMWLQALSAPPKRERLKPLLEGASLQAGKYRILHSLGVGGQGSAYLSTDNINDRAVVLKEFILPVHVDVGVRKSALESFENEARILKQLNNSRIVKLIDFFVEDHRAYLVLEHIDGMSLRDLVEKNGAMQESQVKELAVQMCSILSYLHSLAPPVVHRDFTPDNLILQRDGTLKLIDFNVAQQVEATVTGTVVGKHAYLPPEQFRGMPTSQSDIFACGATLHFLLTGADPEPISQSHPAKQMPNLSAGIDHIVAHATQLDCGLRYENVEQMAEDLSTLA